MYFSNAVFRINTTDVELFKCGTKSNFQPYLYGIAFAAHQSPWQLVDDMQDIEHTPPMRTTVTTSDGATIWSVLMLKGLLDNSSPAAYGNSKSSFIAKVSAGLLDWILSSPKLIKSLVKEIGDSMVFFSIYETDD